MVSDAPIVVPLTVIVAAVETATGLVVMVNAPDVAPAGTVQVAGFAAAWLLTSISVKPLVGAAEPRVTVPFAPTPPMTVVGVIVTFVATGALMVSDALIAVPLAVILTVVNVATGRVVTENVPVFAPPGIVQAAADAAPELLTKVIV